jgi:hypothetical protein
MKHADGQMDFSIMRLFLTLCESAYKTDRAILAEKRERARNKKRTVAITEDALKINVQKKTEHLRTAVSQLQVRLKCNAT